MHAVSIAAYLHHHGKSSRYNSKDSVRVMYPRYSCMCAVVLWCKKFIDDDFLVGWKLATSGEDSSCWLSLVIRDMTLTVVPPLAIDVDDCNETFLRTKTLNADVVARVVA
jgi:hypothetical protein